jgi:hypothetical protein
MAKERKGPCKAKVCEHSAEKHDLKGKGNCIVRGCPCPGYKN